MKRIRLPDLRSPFCLADDGSTDRRSDSSTDRRSDGSGSADRRSDSSTDRRSDASGRSGDRADRQDAAAVATAPAAGYVNVPAPQVAQVDKVDKVDKAPAPVKVAASGQPSAKKRESGRRGDAGDSNT